LDATNIVTPTLSIITSIGLEHTKILGDTIEAIAREKAGVIKPGKPVVLGNNTPRELLESIAKERGAPCILVPGHPGADFEDENTAIAKTALEYLKDQKGLPLTSTAIEKGLASTPPWRFEVLDLKVSCYIHPKKRDSCYSSPSYPHRQEKMKIVYPYGPFACILVAGGRE